MVPGREGWQLHWGVAVVGKETDGCEGHYGESRTARGRGREKAESRVTLGYLTWVAVDRGGGAIQEDRRSKRLGRKRKSFSGTVNFTHQDASGWSHLIGN